MVFRGTTSLRVVASPCVLRVVLRVIFLGNRCRHLVHVTKTVTLPLVDKCDLPKSTTTSRDHT